MNAKQWFEEKLDEFKDDPEFIAETLVLGVIACLNKALRVQGMTRSELAKRLGTSPAFVSSALNGKPNMTLLTLAKFTAALNLSVSVAVTDKAHISVAAPQNADSFQSLVWQKIIANHDATYMLANAEEESAPRALSLVA